MAGKRPSDMLAHERRRIIGAHSKRRHDPLRCRRVPQSYREVTQPALVTDPKYRAAGQTIAEVLFAPCEQFDQIRRIQTVAHRKRRFDTLARKPVPGAGHLAVVAAVDPVADERPQILGNASLQFNGEIGNAAARIELIWTHDRPSGASADAAPAASAVLADRRIDWKRKVGKDLAEKKIRP